MKKNKLKITISLASLLGANIVPLIGVLFFNWDAGVVVLLYWLENVVIGFYNILRIVFLRVENPVKTNNYHTEYRDFMHHYCQS